MTLLPPAPGSPGPHGHGHAFRALAVTCLVFAYLLVVLGDTVRVTESGMGCRSWPLCNGHVGLAGTYHALLEQSHRYVAAVVTILVAAVFLAARRRARHDPLVYRSAAMSLALIGVQVVLGAVTVLTRNAGWTVALHLADAWLVLGAVTVTVLGAWQPSGQAERPRGLGSAPAGRAGPAAVAAFFALSVSGMLVLDEGASTACPGWPTCGGGALGAGLVALQYLHRSLAILATALIVIAVLRAWRYPGTMLAGRVLPAAALALLAGTVTFGAIVAVTGAPPAAQGIHLAVASALWVAVVAMATPDRRELTTAPGRRRPRSRTAASGT